MQRHVMTTEQQHDRMLHTPMMKLLIQMSIPTVASQLVTIIYNTADTWFVSQISTSASAAVGAAFSLQSLIQAIGYGLGTGSSSLISRRLGEKRDHEAEVYASSAFAAALLFGVILCVVGNIFLPQIMKFLGSTKTMLPYAISYARIILLGAPVFCGSFVLNNILRGQGNANLAMYGLCAGSILNIGLDPLLIFVFKMETAGAALATIISQALSFGILLILGQSKKSILKIRLTSVSKHIKDYWTIISTGIPTICRQGLGSVAAASLNMQAVIYGDAVVAAMSIVNKLYMLLRGITMGIGQGFQPIAGYNYGAGNKQRTKQSFVYACIIGSVMVILVSTVIALFPRQIMNWFRNDEDVINVGATSLLLACAVMPTLAYSTYVNQLYQCLGFRVRATLLASCRQGLFYLPIIWIAPLAIDLLGVQIAQPAADLLTCLVSIPFQIYFFKKYLAE